MDEPLEKVSVKKKDYEIMDILPVKFPDESMVKENNVMSKEIVAKSLGGCKAPRLLILNISL